MKNFKKSQLFLEEDETDDKDFESSANKVNFKAKVLSCQKY